MKLIKQLFVGAAMLVAVTSAQATTFNWGTITPGDITFTSQVGPGSFTDYFNFDVAAPSDSAFGVGSVYVSGRKNVQLNIAGLTMNLFDVFNHNIGSGLDFAISNLGVGSYHLEIAGSGTGALGGQYTAFISVSPVPEADTYAMLLAGLGLMGFVALRRRAD